MESGAQVERENPVAVLHDDYEIICVTTDLTMGGAGGALYPAKRVGKGEANLIAIVGDRASCFHLNIADAVEHIQSKHLLTLHRWGIVNWPNGGQRVALIYDKPQGPSLAEAMAQKKIFSTGEIKKNILPQLIDVLRAFSAKGLTHGAIRPGNIFLNHSNEAVLGECLSTAPSQLQPVPFLTIERGMAIPVGRGVGTIADDIYALGVTVLSLLNGEAPMAHLGSDEILAKKLEHGSFGALGIPHRLPASFTNLLRGMLNDNAEERWTVEAISHWLLGHMPGSVHRASGNKPARPLGIAGSDYNDKRMIAHTLYGNFPEFAHLIESGELAKWVHRASADHQLEERFDKAMTLPMAQRKTGSPERKIMTRILMAFHPAAPIRYAGLSVMPDGIATLLFKAMNKAENVQPVADIILADYPEFWYSMQSGLSPSQSDYMNRLDYATTMLERYGIERCLYETALWAPYLGEGFDQHFVFTPHQYILALEEIAGTPRQPSVPIDKHAAAFLAARDPRFGDSILEHLSDALNEADRVLTMLQILATLQQRFNLPKLPNLANWFNTLLQGAIDRYHNRHSREKVRFELKSAAQLGDLCLMRDTIENPSWIVRDKQGFMQAREEHSLLGLEARALKMEMEPHSSIFAELGREISTVIAGILFIVLSVCYLSFGIG